jgi:protein-S-isoprenylcysteine O-methyltransferase Ste14
MNPENTFRIAMALLFFAALTISASFRYKADRDSGEKVSVKDEGKPLFILLRMGGLLLWLSILAYIVNPSWMSWSKAGLPGMVRWLGTLVGSLCVLLFFWMFRSIGSGITPTVATRTVHKLVKTGPYRYIRHPLYSIGTAFFLSLALISDNWFFGVMAVLAFILLAIRLPNEEAHLIEKFGDEYREYRKTTGAFLPRLRN